MYARTWGETTRGINGEMVTVEVDVTNGMPAFEMVGLPDTAVKEARERVKFPVSRYPHYRQPGPGRPEKGWSRPGPAHCPGGAGG